MQYLSVKNLEKYQHYKDRNPPWVKLHRSFLSDYDLRQFTLSSRLFFACSILLASEVENVVPMDYDYLSQRCGFVVDESVVTPLIKRGLLLASRYHGASSALAPSVSDSDSPLSLSSPKGKESEKGGAFEGFFWSRYPRKIGKGAAYKAWCKINPSNGMCEQIQRQVEAAKSTDQWQRENGRFIPLPATWLHQRRWEDTYEPAAKSVFAQGIVDLVKGGKP